MTARPRIERWSTWTAVAAAALGYAASVAALEQWTREPGFDAAWLVGVAGVIAAPFVADRVTRAGARRGVANVIAVLLHVAPVVLLAMRHRTALVPSVLMLAQGHFLLRAARDPFAGASLAVATLQALAAREIALAMATQWLVPPTALASLAGAVVLHGRAARRHAARALAGVRGAQPLADETARGLRRRIAAAIPLGVAALLLGAVTDAVVTSLSASSRRSRSRSAPLGWNDRPSSGRGRSGWGAPSLPDFASELEHGGAAGASAEEVVMEVVPTLRPRTGEWPESLRLRGLVLDAFDAGGVRVADLSDPRIVHDFDDGERDGWTRLPVPPAERRALSGREITLDIRQCPMPFAGRDWSLLFAPGTALAVDLPEVRHDPDRLLAVPEGSDDWIAYRVQGAGLDLDDPRLRLARATRRDPRVSTGLPPASEALNAMQDEAARIVHGASTDLQRVRRIVDHLRRFDYALDSPPCRDVGAIATFLETRSGRCTHFAATTVLLLRLQGIPSRVVTGFLVSRWSEADGSWSVQARDAHAWAEVWFDDVGWVTVDATPPDSRGAAAAAARAAALAAARSWTRPGGLPLFVLLPVSVVALAVVLALLAARRRSPRAVGLPPGVPLADDYATVLRALERSGFTRRASQTPREFACDVARRREGLAPFRALTEAWYASRFGGAPPAADARALVAALLVNLRSSPPPPRE